MDIPLVLLVVALSFTISSGNQKKEGLEFRPWKWYFRYTIHNQLQPPYFSASILLRIYPRATMIRYMEQSVLQKPKEFVKATFTSPYGYLVDTIHDLTSTYFVNKTYWQISNSSGPLNVGVSSYIPSPGDNVLFNFTQG